MSSKDRLDDHIAPRRVVIVGGGFAGLFAARAFRHSPVEVTVVDRATHHLFQPLLYQCATGVLSEGQIAVPLRGVLRRYENVDCVLGEVVDFDVEERRVLALRPAGTPLEIPYDDLIVAAGVQQSYFGHDEFQRFAPGMKTLADALTIRRRVFGAFEMAQTATDPAERRRWLTFALVGAGPTGVELAGQIHEVATLTLRDQFRHIDPDEARVLLFDGGTMPLAPFGPKLSARAAKALTGMGVELHMGSIVTSIDSQGLDAKGADGTVVRHEAGTVLWTAGVAAPPLARAAGQADRRGAGPGRPHRGAAGPHDPGHPEISVVGDLMSLEHLPGVAEVAMQTGFYAAHRIKHEVEQRPGAAEAVPLPRPRLGRVHLPRAGRRLGQALPRQRLHRLAGLARDPPRVPHHLPEPDLGRADVGHRVQPGVTPGARVHDDADRPRPGRLPAAAGARPTP